MEAIEEQIPAAEMERMMKAQEVILKAAAGKLTWMAAAEIMGVWPEYPVGRREQPPRRTTSEAERGR